MSAPTSGPLVRALVLRYGEHICPSKDTIGEHQAVLQEHGLMLFGKFGVAVARSRREKLRRQIEAGVPTYVYFTKRAGGRNLIHRARIVGIPEDDLSGRKHLVPAYYRDAMHTVSFWLLCDSLEEDSVAIADLVEAMEFDELTDELRSATNDARSVKIEYPEQLQPEVLQELPRMTVSADRLFPVIHGAARAIVDEVMPPFEDVGRRRADALRIREYCSASRPSTHEGTMKT